MLQIRGKLVGILFGFRISQGFAHVGERRALAVLGCTFVEHGADGRIGCDIDILGYAFIVL